MKNQAAFYVIKREGTLKLAITLLLIQSYLR